MPDRPPSGSDPGQNEGHEIAERVRAACIQAALEAYEDAGLRGLCAEGRWEVAVHAMRAANLSTAARPR